MLSSRCAFFWRCCYTGLGRVVVMLVVLGHVVLSRRHDVVGWLSVDGRSWQSRRTDERTNERSCSVRL